MKKTIFFYILHAVIQESLTQKNIKVLVTGNRGYIGSVLTQMLLEKGHVVTGYDLGYYATNALAEMPKPQRQIKRDIRDASPEDFANVEAVVHLAALSNDPLGDLTPNLTEEINFIATVRLAELAKAAGVKRFVYSSTTSIYGIANTQIELDEDTGEKKPITAYAKAKWSAEQALHKMGTDSFTVVCLRPSTVFGASPSMRCDIVLNNLVGWAYTTGRIEIKSDGTPWRPMVHVRDVSQAFIAALEAPQGLVAGAAFNVGKEDGNFTVRQLAEAAARAVPGSKLYFAEHRALDSRTYRLSFKKILSVLKDYYQPQWDIDRGAQELVDFFRKVNFTEEQFHGRVCNRLAHIKFLLENGQLDKNLRYTNGAS